MAEKICPRCGKPYSYINKIKIKTGRGVRVYNACVHVLGYYIDPKTGKRKKKVKVCYIGRAEGAAKAAKNEKADDLAKLINDILSGGVDVSRLAAHGDAASIAKKLRELAEAIERSIREATAAAEKAAPPPLPAPSLPLSDDMPSFVKDNPWLSLLSGKKK